MSVPRYDSLLKRLSGRLTKSGTSAPPRHVHTNRLTADTVAGSPAAGGIRGSYRLLEDLIVQTEIFFSIRLQIRRWSACKRAVTFPVEKKRNTRPLRNLYQTATGGLR